MVEQKTYQASQGWLKRAVDALVAAGVEVQAPVEEQAGNVALARVDSADAIAASYLNLLVPLKRVFFPETEVLLEFENDDDGGVTLSDPPELPSGGVVVLGSRPCDAAALTVLDRVFQWDYDDVPYRTRRERTTVVSFACAEPDATCFCTSVGGSPHGAAGSDVVVFPAADGGALLQVHSEKGEKLMELLGDAVTAAPADAALPDPPEVPPRFDPERVKTWLDDNFESSFWSEAALNCVGCAACSYLCPTCHCFDIVDEAAWNKGERRRCWDCCSFGLFTLHASGHNPRPDQAARYRQRVMHKFKYFPERFDAIACVGCGRCVRACGMGQSLSRVVAAIEANVEAGETTRA
ncbi:4Fe-4S dicluster domain-containing protein [bacterium]|nr:4Fe-4S dicluster domain-containing protein [bacterium]